MKTVIEIGKCEDVLKDLEEDSIDCIITDPPYGLDFMGMNWDKALPTEEALRECCRVLKPGAFGFFMCTPRQDLLSRMIIRLEDCGFMTGFTSLWWCYATGFPKASDMSKLVDKRLGAERTEIIKMQKTSGYLREVGGGDGWDERISSKSKDTTHGDVSPVYAPATPEAQSLNGAYAGFQPKPACEPIVCCQKPLTVEAQLTITSSTALYYIGEVCKWLSVNSAESSLFHHPIVREYIAQRNAMDLIVQEAKANIGKVASHYELTDMLRFILDELTEKPDMNLNTGLLWKSVLADLLANVNKFTISTAEETIIELKTLNLLLSQSIPENTTILTKTPRNGLRLNVNIVENFMLNVLIKLQSLNQITVAENVISKGLTEVQPLYVNSVEKSSELQNNFMPEIGNTVLRDVTTKQGKELEIKPIICVMKPLSEKTYVDQALKNGKGVTWLGNCKIPYQSEGDKEFMARGWSEKSGCFTGKGLGNNVYGKYGTNIAPQNETGRFPANVLCSDNVLDDGTEHKRGCLKPDYTLGSKSVNVYGERTRQPEEVPADSGTFSRYFDLDAWFAQRAQQLPEAVKKTYPYLIVPKPSKAENTRNGTIENNHPTKKPVKLMSYLITLGSREGDLILDPYAGSGKTGQAARLMNRDVILIEKDEQWKPVIEKICMLDVPMQVNLKSFGLKQSTLF